jgi:hypothetical protein
VRDDIGQLVLWRILGRFFRRRIVIGWLLIRRIIGWILNRGNIHRWFLVGRLLIERFDRGWVIVLDRRNDGADGREWFLHIERRGS